MKTFVSQVSTLEPAMSAIPTDSFLLIPPESLLECTFRFSSSRSTPIIRFTSALSRFTGCPFNCSARIIVTGSIARSATRRHLSYSEADFEVFRPEGATRCTDGGEIWHGPKVPSSMSNFTPTLQRLGHRTPKLKFLLRFDKMWNINVPQGRIPYAIFITFAEFVPLFRMR